MRRHLRTIILCSMAFPTLLHSMPATNCLQDHPLKSDLAGIVVHCTKGLVIGALDSTLGAVMIIAELAGIRLTGPSQGPDFLTTLEAVQAEQSGAGDDHATLATLAKATKRHLGGMSDKDKASAICQFLSFTGFTIAEVAASTPVGGALGWDNLSPLLRPFVRTLGGKAGKLIAAEAAENAVEATARVSLRQSGRKYLARTLGAMARLRQWDHHTASKISEAAASIQNLLAPMRLAPVPVH